MNSEFNLISVIRTLLKWKWHIVATTVIAGIAAIIVSVFVMKPYYQSFALLYPTNQSMADRSALFGNDAVESDAYYYGTKHDANRIITLATSSTLVQYIIQEYNLAEHYEYKGKKYEATYTSEEFYGNYQVYKTDKDAIRINFIDTDPALAKTIVDDVVATIQFETSKPIQENKRQLAELFEQQAVAKKAVSDDLLKQLLNSNLSPQELKAKNMEHENAVIEYNETAKLASEYALAAEQKMPGVEVIEPAYQAEKKLKPVRSRICIGTVIFTFFFACLGALLIEQVNYIREQL